MPAVHHDPAIRRATLHGRPQSASVGVIPTGAVFYLQDDAWWRSRDRDKPVCREPWIVEGFFNGTMGAARRNRDTGEWESVYLSGRSDMALVRSLRNGRKARIAVRTLVLHEDEGLRRDEQTYPSWPDLSLYGIARRSALRLAA